MNSYIFALSVCIIIGYFTGCINPAYLLSRMKGFDIRQRGSLNAGASNAVITIGKKAGLFCAIFDIFKAYISIKITTRLYPLIKIAGIVTSVACILGHIFPITMRFNGGKGLACIGGSLLAYNPKLFVLLLGTEIIIALVSTYICSIATSGSIIIGIILFFKEGWLSALIFLPVILAVLYKHLINFRRIRYGVEVKVSYLWAKEKEEERVKNNWNKLSIEERNYVKLLELA